MGLNLTKQRTIFCKIWCKSSFDLEPIHINLQAFVDLFAVDNLFDMVNDVKLASPTATPIPITKSITQNATQHPKQQSLF